MRLVVNEECHFHCDTLWLCFTLTRPWCMDSGPSATGYGLNAEYLDYKLLIAVAVNTPRRTICIQGTVSRFVVPRILRTATAVQSLPYTKPGTQADIHAGSSARHPDTKNLFAHALASSHAASRSGMTDIQRSTRIASALGVIPGPGRQYSPVQKMQRSPGVARRRVRAGRGSVVTVRAAKKANRALRATC